MCWVKWANITKDFERGGLNIGCLESTNLSLIGKWWWRFLNENNALWVTVIKSLYGERGGLWGNSCGFDGAGNTWTNIIRIGEILDNKGTNFTRSFG